LAIANAYFVPTEDLQTALIEAARRGVTVQVVTNSDATNDIPVITKAGRARYLPLIDAGVQVYEWHAERIGEGTLHAKFAVVDGRVTVIGSHNLDPRSQGLNSEDAVLIDDLRIAEELQAYFADKDLPLADRITREQAVAWVDPRDLPAAAAPLIPWTDARFDPAVFEFMLLQAIEGSL
jgi:cardiolipin synthase